MRNPTRKLVVLAVAALAVATACGKADNSAEGGGVAQSIASADEVLKVVDQGFAVFGSSREKRVSYGFVVENVSDQVAVTVRVEVGFTDEAGNPIPDVHGSGEFSAVLPGQRMGTGDLAMNGTEVIPDAMTVRVTLIASLDTPDGERHLKSAGPYAELATSDPVPSRTNAGRQSYTAEVTNTYDAPIKPLVTAVARDAGGAIVGGSDGGHTNTDPERQSIAPGEHGPVLFHRAVASPKLAEATLELYADPGLGKLTVSNPVWQVLD